MSRFERPVEVDDGSFAERRLNFVLALIVATVIAAASAYALRGALLGPGYGPAHRTAARDLARAFLKLAAIQIDPDARSHLTLGRPPSLDRG